MDPLLVGGLAMAVATVGAILVGNDGGIDGVNSFVETLSGSSGSFLGGLGILGPLGFAFAAGVVTVSWDEWKRLHPDTRLLVSDDKETFGSRYATDPFAGYPASLNAGRFPFPVSEDRLDSRLRAGEIVVAAEVGSAVRAYPLRLIGDAAVNDRVGSTPIVIFSRGLAGAVFLSTASGKQLTFRYDDGLFIDAETGSTWDAFGRAVAGSLEGAALKPVPTRRAFWFSVAGAIPGLELYPTG